MRAMLVGRGRIELPQPKARVLQSQPGRSRTFAGSLREHESRFSGRPTGAGCTGMFAAMAAAVTAENDRPRVGRASKTPAPWGVRPTSIAGVIGPFGGMPRRRAERANKTGASAWRPRSCSGEARSWTRCLAVVWSCLVLPLVLDPGDVIERERVEAVRDEPAVAIPADRLADDGLRHSSATTVKRSQYPLGTIVTGRRRCDRAERARRRPTSPRWLPSSPHSHRPSACRSSPGVGSLFMAAAARTATRRARSPPPRARPTRPPPG